MTIDPHNQTKAPRDVVILGFRDVLMLDIAGPAQVFGAANKLLHRTAYQMRIVTACGADVRTDTGLSLGSSGAFDSVSQADDFMIPGGPGVDQLLEDAATLAFITAISSKAERTLSICSGSLLAAASGILDGKRATSHWERSGVIAARFPAVDWQLDHIFTQDGRFHCSAGVTAGIDLALNIVEQDHDRQLALDVAREMVVFIRRTGGQSQYSRPLQAQSSTTHRLSALYAQIEANPAGDWSVQRMAEVMRTTERTLHRDFIRDLQMTPSRFVLERRIAIARTYLEQSRTSLKEIAVQSGFVTEEKMRRSFQKMLGVLPSTYRQSFGTAP